MMHREAAALLKEMGGTREVRLVAVGGDELWMEAKDMDDTTRCCKHAHYFLHCHSLHSLFAF